MVCLENAKAVFCVGNQIAVSERLRVFLDGDLVADTEDGFRVLETHHAPTYYLPPDSVVASLTRAPGQSLCEWKGAAAYWDIALGEVRAPRAAWSYPEPSETFLSIKGYLAFYASEVLSCFVGDEPVRPQPGSFYGGWVTDNLRGEIKGAAGTEHW